MRDISLHVLDIVENSVKAKARLVSVSFSKEGNALTIVVDDDGCGMSKEMLENVKSPFTTSRTTRKVGMGIPLLTENAQLTGGDVKIESEIGRGTTLTALFYTDHIDCLPLGDLAATVQSLIIANPESPDFDFTAHSERGDGEIDTRQIRALVDPLPLSEPDIISWIGSAANEELVSILGGTNNENFSGT
ncbi:MAG: ATP-binding protein [Eubacteriales bacterium]|nr:ATP-binding protein [Eubacteriales bacterium]MDD3882122.1 ATP-binding protein [Eubacteriales bacterium]MDD4513227.1 ATP-binding protein [Eubacteriales bacterium]